MNRAKAKMGSKNPNWKGDDVGYKPLHSWIRDHKTKTEKCENCGTYDIETELANISGEYKRDVKDYKWLCRKCHMIEDGRMFKKDNKGRFCKK